MKKSYILVLVLLCLSYLFVRDAEAQCAMCRATLEGDEAQRGDASRLNMGILYLMVIPYIAVGTIAYFWYKQYKKNKMAKESN